MKALEMLKHYKKVTANMPHGMPTKRINEAIAELEALQQPKSCYDCKHWFPNKASYPCNQCSMAINCLFEPKEQ